MPQKTLNLMEAEIGKYAKLLSNYDKIPTKEEHILYRTKIGLSTVTLYSSGKLLIQGDDCDEVYDKLHARLETQELAIGIDEAGRGENTGSLVVAGILGNRNSFREVRDSKKTKDIAEKYHKVLSSAEDAYIVEIRSNEIDHFRKSGKTMNVLQAEMIEDIVRRLRNGKPIPVYIDGSALPTHASGITYVPQGDDKDSLISAASILARHTRDVSDDRGKRKTWKEKLKKPRAHKKSA